MLYLILCGHRNIDSAEKLNLVLPYRVVLSKTLRVSVEGIFENSLADLE